VRRLAWVSGLLWAAAAAAAGQDKPADVAQELDRELRVVAHVPAPAVEILFEGVESEKYELVEASFQLDGRGLPQPLKPGKLGRAPITLFSGTVAPGPHTFTADLVLKDAAPQGLFSYGDTHRFRIGQEVSLAAQSGLLVRLRTWVRVNDQAEDVTRRLKLVAKLDPQMLARVDEPPSPSGGPHPVDAGSEAVVAQRPPATPPPLSSTAPVPLGPPPPPSPLPVGPKRAATPTRVRTPSRRNNKATIPASLRKALVGGGAAPAHEDTPEVPKSLLERLRKQSAQ
jgi:hypothetical protein